ncbi:50S ribosomal protein L5 [Candidatus Wolfebacteria bacterium]|nr:50S ribosomal protein L5 [Candidatus Wolfebacteria bacterium]
MKKEYKKLDKVVVNLGLGRASAQPGFEDKLLPQYIEELNNIVGQKAQIRKATKSIAGFKLREGTVVGLRVTLRRNRMNEFLEKLSNIVLPRVRDFRGIKESAVDAGGSLNIGLKEHVVFPEVNTEIMKVNFGLEITIVPKVKNREEAMELYKAIGIPFKKN